MSSGLDTYSTSIQLCSLLSTRPPKRLCSPSEALTTPTSRHSLADAQLLCSHTALQALGLVGGAATV